MKRRSFLKRTAAVLVGGWASRDNVARSEESLPRVKPDVVLYQGQYPGWPWLTRIRSGTMLCVFREGTEHGFSASGKAMLVRSDDDGRTWSPASAIVDEPGVDDRNVAISELPNGDLLVVYNTYTSADESVAMTTRSSDGGRTWQKPNSVGTPNTRTRAAAVALANGELVLPYYIAPGSGALAARSTDNGLTWTTVRIPDVTGFVGDEWDALEVEPGRLVGIFRNSHPQSDGTFWKAESRDGGRNWTSPQPTNIRSLRYASPPQIVRQSDRPTVIYSDRRMVSVSAVTTRDPDFLRWDVGRKLECYRYRADESPITDSSYPVSAPVSASTRLIVDYEIRSETRQISGYFVTFPATWSNSD
jgi:photosystem II stability/assembly factor-like uncharacterized protein